MKLLVTDIIVLNEGKQVKNAILKKYSTLQEFIECNNISIYLSSIEVYLRSRVITSKKFKIALLMAFGKEYKEIVVSEQMQLKKHVEIIWNNLDEYNENSHLE